ncbi:acyl-CoA dehydrogenase family protein [Alicyclobacillus macrosporangiidus]|uniref:acyl-CoA dehydrogenase family protein n=1 Tax=Alicyclobacillus macrosporangiidus TaxID=392015 RepID=UPI0009DEDF54|nr:acyl-CoA dehydrogenase family protein [Alicyclobacillus macrosporangiidus]
MPDTTPPANGRTDRFVRGAGVYDSPEHERFRTALRRFLATELVPHLAEWEAQREVPRWVWRRFGELGYLCPWLEEEYGGSGGDFTHSVIVMEEMALAGVDVEVSLHSDIIAPYIHQFGTPEQKRRWLPGCASGETLLAIAMTEPDAGSDLAAIRTRAVKDGNDYIIDGSKTFISNGAHCDLVIVACRTDSEGPAHKGITLIAVENGAPGFTKGRKLNKLGHHTHGTAELFFESCRVPQTNRIGAEGRGFYYMMRQLQRERLVAAIGSQVNAEAMFELTLQYVKARQAFGQPIGRFQYIAFKMAEMETEIELGRTFLNDLIRDFLHGTDITRKVSMAKWWIAEMANRVAYQCTQLHGGYGYMEEYEITRRFRNVRMDTIAAGTTEIMKMILAKGLGLQ